MAPDPRLLRAQRFPLHSAVQAGNLLRLTALLDTDTKNQVNRRYENSGQTPLHLAASLGDIHIIEALLGAQAKLEEPDCMRQTALHYSLATSRNTEATESLLRAGAEVNPRRLKDGWTPLFLATVFGHTAQVKVLLSAGADVLLADCQGWTPEDWAARYRLKQVQRLLRAAPRVVTEQSGKRYQETVVEERLEVPVEFDEGINNLLKRIEEKRRKKIENDQRRRAERAVEEAVDRKQEEEKRREEKEETERKSREEESRIALDEEEENQRFLEEAAAKVEERQKRLQGKKEGILESNSCLASSSAESLASVLDPVPESDADVTNKASPSPLEREISSPTCAISEWNNLVEISRETTQGDISLEPGVISVQGDISLDPLSAGSISAQADISTDPEVPALIVETLESVREKMAAVTVRDRQEETLPKTATGVKVLNGQEKIPAETAAGVKVLETAVTLEQYKETPVNLEASQTAAKMKALDTAVAIEKYQDTAVSVAVCQTETVACLGQNKGQTARVATAQLRQQETCHADRQKTNVIEENSQTLGPEKSLSVRKELGQLVKEDTSEHSKKDTALSNEETQCMNVEKIETVTSENQLGSPETKKAVKEMINKASELGPTEKSGALKLGPAEKSEAVNMTGQVTEELPTLAKVIPIMGIESLKTASSVDSDKKLLLKVTNTPVTETETILALVSSVLPPATANLQTPKPTPNAAAKTTNPDLPPATPINGHRVAMSLEEQLTNCQLPDTIDDSDFQNKLKVFNNYRNFGAMYRSKNNFKKAEWAFKNGIKQAVGGERPRSKEQLRAVLGAEVEFRLDRARSLIRLGQTGEARTECSLVLGIDCSNTEAPTILSTMSL